MFSYRWEVQTPGRSTTEPEAASGSFPGNAYLSESVNLAQASADTLSVKPARSVVSRTRITPAPLAVSTQLPPDVPE